MTETDMDYVLSFPLDDAQKKQLQDEVKNYLASSSSNDDDVLVEYIMVMCHNGKSMGHIANCLEELIGKDDAVAFANWFRQLIQRYDPRAESTNQESSDDEVPPPSSLYADNEEEDNEAEENEEHQDQDEAQPEHEEAEIEVIEEPAEENETTKVPVPKGDLRSIIGRAPEASARPTRSSFGLSPRLLQHAMAATTTNAPVVNRPTPKNNKLPPAKEHPTAAETHPVKKQNARKNFVITAKLRPKKPLRVVKTTEGKRKLNVTPASSGGDAKRLSVGRGRNMVITMSNPRVKPIYKRAAQFNLEAALDSALPSGPHSTDADDTGDWEVGHDGVRILKGIPIRGRGRGRGRRGGRGYRGRGGRGGRMGPDGTPWRGGRLGPDGTPWRGGRLGPDGTPWRGRGRARGYRGRGGRRGRARGSRGRGRGRARGRGRGRGRAGALASTPFDFSQFSWSRDTDSEESKKALADSLPPTPPRE